MKTKKKNLRRWLIPMTAAAVVIILMKTVFLIGYVPSESMEPTVQKDSFILGCRVYPALRKGNIIIFRQGGKLLVKRIAAVAGDTVEKGEESLVVPTGYYYVLGDNSANSFDSRYWEEPFVKDSEVVALVIG